MSRHTPTPTRRTILKAGGLLAVGGIATAGHSFAQSELELSIEQFPVEEYISITNNGDSDADITGYSINFEGETDDYNQTRQIAGEAVIPADEERTVATGAQTTVETDWQLADPYTGPVLRNDGSDVVSLLNPDGEVVASTGDPDDPEEPGDGNGDDDPDRDGTGDEPAAGGGNETESGDGDANETAPDDGDENETDPEDPEDC